MEEWIFYNGYFVSSEGRIKGKKGNILKQYPNSANYYRVHFQNKLRLVHRIVALCFVKNTDPKHKTQVDHIDGNKHNNCKNNLQWLSPSENTKKSFTQTSRKRNKKSILIFKDGEFIAEVTNCYKATKYLVRFGFNPKDSQFVMLTAKGGFHKYKGFNFYFAKELFE